MNNYPPLPKLDGELMLLVFTHKSVAQGHTDEEYGDTDRLSELGTAVFSTAVTHHLFSIRPMLTAAEIMTRKQELLADETINNWVSIYRLMDKLRGYSRDPGNATAELEESRHLFYSYVGAVHAQDGFSAVQSWISRLVSPDSEPPLLAGGAQGLASSTAPSPPNSISTSAITLALFNQTAMQRGMAIEWQAESSGPPHNPRWIVTCRVNSVEKSRGAGKNLKLAKEEAARQAWAALGWV